MTDAILRTGAYLPMSTRKHPAERLKPPTNSRNVAAPQSWLRTSWTFRQVTDAESRRRLTFVTKVGPSMKQKTVTWMGKSPLTRPRSWDTSHLSLISARTPTRRPTPRRADQTTHRICLPAWIPPVLPWLNRWSLKNAQVPLTSTISGPASREPFDSSARAACACAARGRLKLSAVDASASSACERNQSAQEGVGNAYLELRDLRLQGSDQARRLLSTLQLEEALFRFEE